MAGVSNDHRDRPLVAVTGLGVVSNLGIGLDDSWAALKDGKSGIRALSRFPTEGMRTRIAGTVDAIWQDGDGAVELTLRGGILAADEAVAMAGIGTPGDFPGPLFAAVPPTEMEWSYRNILYDRVKSSAGDAYDRMINVAQTNNDHDGYLRTLLGYLSERLADHIGTRGAPVSLTTACASGATAIQLAVEAVRRGDTDAAIAIGADCSVSPEAIIRFNLLSALSGANDEPEKASKPFAKDREGFVIAEGAAALVFEKYAAAKARGANVLAVVRGISEKADDFHRTRSKPDGSAIIAAISNTLDDAGMQPDEIDYINAHGTGTPENDKMEAMSLTAVFGEAIRHVPISSNKSMIGHTLTAAGAIEAAFSIKTLTDGVIPPTINYKIPDPAIDLDVVPNQARKASVDTVLSNSFGFGGQNACLVFSRDPA
ncbi:MAG: beta-ketoacyl-ACP synthase [Alphaproteobacteria bacterium]